jgi:hypothetical protein
MFGNLAKLGKSYAKGLLPFMLSSRGCKGGRLKLNRGGTNVSATHGVHRDNGFFETQQCLFFEALIYDEKLWGKTDTNMVP